MGMMIHGDNVGQLWHSLLFNIVGLGNVVKPRGIECHELLNVSLELTNARLNLLKCETRNISYRFAVAEWLWIYFGYTDVKTIAQYNPHIAQFSDNGMTFNGAYGAPVRAQWDGIVKLLKNDPYSRQAVIVIFRPQIGPTKDVPCTISLQFFVRSGFLHVTANMRSSDAWLGLPYDIFVFTMLGNLMAAELEILVGSFVLNAGSSHIYKNDFEKAEAVLELGDIESIESPMLPALVPGWISMVLTNKALPNEACIDSVWRRYALALIAPTNAIAMRTLSEDIHGPWQRRPFQK